MPPRVTVPDPTNKMFEPIAAIWSCACCWAPCPTLTIAITAPTPMMIPNIVRADRSLLRAKARIAILRMAVKFIRSSIFQYWHLAQHFARHRTIPHGLVVTNLSITEMNGPLRKICDVRLVRDEHDRQSF